MVPVSSIDLKVTKDVFDCNSRFHILKNAPTTRNDSISVGVIRSIYFDGQSHFHGSDV